MKKYILEIWDRGKIIELLEIEVGSLQELYQKVDYGVTFKIKEVME